MLKKAEKKILLKNEPERARSAVRDAQLGAPGCHQLHLGCLGTSVATTLMCSGLVNGDLP